MGYERREERESAPGEPVRITVERLRPEDLEVDEAARVTINPEIIDTLLAETREPGEEREPGETQAEPTNYVACGNIYQCGTRPKLEPGPTPQPGPTPEPG